MGETTLTRMRLSGGIWEGLLASDKVVPPRLALRHENDHIGEPEVLAEGNAKGRWLVRFHLPLERIADGVQTFVVEDSDTGAALAHETIVAGDPLEEDLHAEVSLLRAELDLLKQAFRTHCREG